MPIPQKDYYKILQVDPSASNEVIKAAYRRLAREYHPDVNQSPDATQRMKDINAAYEVLSNPLRRAQYDRLRRDYSNYSGSTQTVQEQWRRSQAAEAQRAAAAQRAQREAEARRAQAEARRAQAERAEREAEARRRQEAIIQWFAMLAVMIALRLIGDLIFGDVSPRGGSDSSSRTDNHFAIATSTASPTVIGARETQQADSLVLTPPSDWTWHLEDDFHANVNHWREGRDEASECGSMVRDIRDNKYFWTIDSLGGCIWYAVGPSKTLTWRNYLISVETELVEGESDVVYSGITLNYNSSTHYASYAFGFYYDGFWFFNRISSDGDDWTDLGHSRSAAIHVKGANQLIVHVMKGHFTLFINGEKVGYVEDAINPGGKVGLIVGTTGSESPATVVFDNFEIQGEPPSQ